MSPVKLGMSPVRHGIGGEVLAEALNVGKPTVQRRLLAALAQLTA